MIEEAIHDRIDAAISGSEVYQLRRQQHADLPVIRVQLIDDPRFSHLRGKSGRHRARVQIDIFTDATVGSDPYNAAADLVEEVEGALTPEPFVVGSDIEVLNATRADRRANDEAPMGGMVPSASDEVRISMDYIVWYKNL